MRPAAGPVVLLEDENLFACLCKRDCRGQSACT
jgi:hypothetical protein